MTTKTRKCQVCKMEEAVYLWQPAGPDPDRRNCFPFPGWQYRSFASVPCCENCKAEIKAGKDIRFTYKKNDFILHEQQITTV